MSESFKVWEPGQELVKDKYLVEVRHDSDGLTLILCNINKESKIKINFATHFTYQSTNESYRLKSLYQRLFTNGINVSKASGLLNWFKEETHGIYDDLDPTHYLICSNDDVTDVISAEHPTIELIQ